jgi:hypothetical protein
VGTTWHAVSKAAGRKLEGETATFKTVAGGTRISQTVE